MEKLTEEEMSTWAPLLGARDALFHPGRAHEMLLAAITEIREHRAARVADAERIKSVVEAAVWAEMGKHDNDSIQEADWIEIREAIARRAAEQLALPSVGLMAKVIALREAWLPHADRKYVAAGFIDDLNKIIEDK